MTDMLTPSAVRKIREWAKAEIRTADGLIQTATGILRELKDHCPHSGKKKRHSVPESAPFPSWTECLDCGGEVK